MDILRDINKKYAAAMNYPSLDRFMTRILWWHFGVLVLMTGMNSWFRIAEQFKSPLSWRVISPKEAIICLVIGLIITLIPQFLKDKFENHFVWRLLVATMLTIYSYLYVFLSGGAIEMHFHFFIVIALLVIYSDWRLGWWVLILTGLHHGVLNYLAPNWVYYYGRSDLSVIVHAVPVLAEVIFTTILSESHRRSIETVATLKDGLEETVGQRTKELQEKLTELERLNDLMVGRELKMAELKKEIDDKKS